MNDYKDRVFQAAIELAFRTTSPKGGTIANVIDRLAGANRLSASPEVYKNTDWACDFLSCLPENPEYTRLLILCYLPAYVCSCSVIHLEPGRCDDCGSWPEPYRFALNEARFVGGLARSFWNRIQARRLFSRGLSIVERG